MGIRRGFQAHPYMITWWDDTMNATTMSFLIQPLGGISSALVARNSLGSVIIDGPYGKDHHLEDYENVILIARGIGIAGILPYIRHMAYRRLSKNAQYEAYRRGMITRKLDVFWVIEDESQEDLVKEWLLELQQKDSERVCKKSSMQMNITKLNQLLLAFTCFPPYPIKRGQLLNRDSHWRSIDQRPALPIIEELIRKQIQRSPGRTKVAGKKHLQFYHVL